MSEVSAQMPRYKSHKEVWALKIKAMEAIPAKTDPATHAESGGGATITPEDSGFGQFAVSADYIRKHKPQVGGYYVVYKDGYESFSPAGAFEEGYTLIA